MKHDDVWKERRILKRVYKKKPAMPVESLMKKPRFACKEDDWESGYEYGFFSERVSKYTDEEIEALIDDMWESTGVSWSPSGRMFTVSIEWHRNPCGLVSYVHCRGIDV